MFCRKCGNEIPNDSLFCPHCGVGISGTISPLRAPTPPPPPVPVETTSPQAYRVTIHGYTEWYAKKWYISVYQEGVHVAELTRFEQWHCHITKDTLFKFKCGFRSTQLIVKSGQDAHILLSFDRFTGSIKAYLANNNNLSSVTMQRQQKSSNATTMSLGCIIACLLFPALLFLMFLASL